MEGLRKTMSFLEDKFEHKLPAIEFSLKKEIKLKANDDEIRKLIQDFVTKEQLKSEATDRMDKIEGKIERMIKTLGITVPDEDEDEEDEYMPQGMDGSPDDPNSPGSG